MVLEMLQAFFLLSMLLFSKKVTQKPWFLPWEASLCFGCYFLDSVLAWHFLGVCKRFGRWRMVSYRMRRHTPPCCVALGLLAPAVSTAEVPWRVGPSESLIKWLSWLQRSPQNTPKIGWLGWQEDPKTLWFSLGFTLTPEPILAGLKIPPRPRAVGNWSKLPPCCGRHGRALIILLCL